MQTATFAKRRHYAVTVRGIHPEALSIDNISGRESLKSELIIIALINFKTLETVQLHMTCVILPHGHYNYSFIL